MSKMDCQRCGKEETYFLKGFNEVSPGVWRDKISLCKKCFEQSEQKNSVERAIRVQTLRGVQKEVLDSYKKCLNSEFPHNGYDPVMREGVQLGLAHVNVFIGLKLKELGEL